MDTALKLIKKLIWKSEYNGGQSCSDKMVLSGDCKSLV